MVEDEKICADIKEEVTPIVVRDTIINCFMNAHKEILEQMKEYSEFKSEEEFEEMERIDVKTLVKKAFSDTGGNFDNPTKESLIKVVSSLKEYAANFRKPEVIEKHSSEIMDLINKLY